MAIFSYVLLLAGAFLFVIIGILISLLGERACLTKRCVDHARFIHERINYDVDPCEDFYSFVCGKFKKFGLTIMDEIAIAQLKRLIKYLKVPQSWEKDDRVLIITKQLFQNCNNDTQLEFEGLKPAYRIISRIGGIPFLDPGWDYNKQADFFLPNTEVNHTIVGLREIFVHHKIIKAKAYPSVKKRGKLEKFYHLFSIPPHLFSAVPPDPKKYVKYCVEFNKLFSEALAINNIITEEDKEELKKAAQFKSELLKLIKYKTKDCSNQPFEFKRYEELINTGLTNYQLQNVIALKDLRAYEPTVILVTANFVKYIKDVDKLLKNVSKRVIANFMGVEALIQMTPFLPGEFREIYKKYLASDKEKNNIMLIRRDLHCAKLIKDEMTTGLAGQYIKNNPDVIKNFPSSMVQGLEKQVKAIIRNIKWASQRDRAKLYHLVKNIKVVSPLPNSVMEKLQMPQALDKLFLRVCINDYSTLENYLSVRSSRMNRNMELILNSDFSVFHEDYDIFGTEIYFHYDTNSIIIPMGYTFYPSDYTLWPKYLSFGGIAVWIVRVIINTVGYFNVIYPELEPIKPVIQKWWAEETVSRYKNNRQCVLDEYNQYLSNLKIKCNDGNCLEETLSNTAAVQAAYFAYKKYVERRFFTEPKLPYFKSYSPDQLFFIKYASSFCYYDELGLKRYKTDIDTARVPNNFTVVSSLRNFPTFSEVFGCEKKDKMIKTKPCKIWVLKT